MRLPSHPHRALMVRHHGVPTVSATAREAFSLTNEVIGAAHIRPRMDATGAELLEISFEVCEHGSAQHELHDRGRASAEWPAHLRKLDRIEIQLPGLSASAAGGISMNPALTLRTGRLELTPIGGADLADFRALAADPRVFAVMLGGVRDAVRASDDISRFVTAWGRYGFGIWTIRERGGRLRRRDRVGPPGGWSRHRPALRFMARGAGARSGA